MTKETYEISLKKDMTCGAGTKVLSLFDTLEEGAHISAKFILGVEKKNGKYPVYIDEITEDTSNMVGKVVSITDKAGTELDDDDVEILAQEEHEIQLTQKDDAKKMMFGSIIVRRGSESKNDEASDTDEILQAIIDEKISAGIVTKEEMDTRLKVFADNKVDKFLMRRVIAGYRKYNKPTHRPSCIFVDPYLEESTKRKEEGIISEGLRGAAGRTALICEGEKSVGKNVYMETIAWLMGMPLRLITMSRNMSPSSIYGEKTTDNSAAEALCSEDATALARALVNVSTGHKESHYLDSAAQFELLKARAASVNIVIDQSELYDWLEDGGVLVFNEMNMCEANFFASFTNQLLDGTGFLFIPGRGEVEINPDCVLFGTQNADYQGVEQQNEATMSRFGCLYFRQPDHIKGQLVAAVSSALVKDGFADVKPDRAYFAQADKFYTQCRDAVQKDVVSNACLNIRGFVRAITATAESEGFAKLKRQIEIHVINTCPFDEREPLYAILDAIVTK